MENCIIPIPSFYVTQYLIIDEGKIYLIDSGFIGSYKCLLKTLAKHGLEDQPIEGVIMTHGHIDHTFYAQKIADEFGAWLAAPLLDKELVYGNYDKNCYGAGYIGACMQTVAKYTFNYRPPNGLIHWFEADHIFPILGGLRAIGVAGHTPGHTVLYSELHHLLFSADIFASYSRCSHMPPPVFNHNTRQAKQCLKQVLNIDSKMKGIYPNHGDTASPEVHLERLKQLASKGN